MYIDTFIKNILENKYDFVAQKSILSDDLYSKDEETFNMTADQLTILNETYKRALEFAFSRTIVDGKNNFEDFKEIHISRYIKKTN